ncbi:hypothetical protein F5Y16DRAFT_357073 [Xylariaceae sp. FL0255]|nr:hypothetical protein F5Y16DRAFT_357073 [Xylariaceae sp. FL0255]
MPPARKATSSLLAAATTGPAPIPTSTPGRTLRNRQQLSLQTPLLCSFLYPPSTLPIYQCQATTTRTYRTVVCPNFTADVHSSRTCQKPRQGDNRLQHRNRLFHITTPRRATVNDGGDDAIDNARNHYETLKLAPGASASEIKKSFYTLSKTHHPDLQPPSHRATASQRFMRISEAYAILSNPTKRAKYDREQSFTPSSSHTPGQRQPGTSYYSSSNNPAGGRPASGLSRRRGTYQGPPPSFYRSGGWGAHGDRRRAAHEESTGTGTGGFAGGGGAGGSTEGGMGPGQDPFHRDNNTPHFDREAHERTGRRTTARHQDQHPHPSSSSTSSIHPKSSTSHHNPVDFGSIDPEHTPLSMFFVIGGMLAVSMFASILIGGAISFGGGGGGRRNERLKSVESSSPSPAPSAIVSRPGPSSAAAASLLEPSSSAAFSSSPGSSSPPAVSSSSSSSSGNRDREIEGKDNIEKGKEMGDEDKKKIDREKEKGEDVEN